ncbi:MAG: replication-associated recombination protein A [Phycisphaeraceae bacterium]|nr:MAG: replication-associated recombination protein A [Phycisphaeraceae bacterium]
MADLWASKRDERRREAEPLAVRMRPRTLDEFVGQGQILGPGKLLRRMLDAGAVTSLILYGPPGTGKTTLAEVIASRTKRHFERENAASVGVKRIREIIDEASDRLGRDGRRTILFLDEVHRFTRAQQDVLLADVERGLITLIGATTENPLFAVNAALVSRSTLLRLEPLTEDEIKDVLRRAAADPERGMGRHGVTVLDEALDLWARVCDGDARRALTALEVAVLSLAGEGGVGGAGSGEGLVIDAQVAEESIQRKAVVYDHTGDGHYDAASALIKSVRGGDPDAGLYWLAHMLAAGEDPRFIARRMAILASEDVGNADPQAITLAAAAWTLVERIGMPEARITLAQLVTYLALAPKSNASYTAIGAAMEDVEHGRTAPVPLYLRDPNSSPVAGGSGRGVRTKEAGGETYEYSHDARGGITGQDYLGVEREYYHPTDRGEEAAMRETLEEVRRLRKARRTEGGA